jgi:hypothetical protein
LISRYMEDSLGKNGPNSSDFHTQKIVRFLWWIPVSSQKYRRMLRFFTFVSSLQERFRSKWRQIPRTSLKGGKCFFKLLKSEPKCSKKVSKSGEFYPSKIEINCFPHYCAKICTQKKTDLGPNRLKYYAFFHDARLLTLMRLT